MSMCLYSSIPTNLCDYINKYYKLFDAADVVAVILILCNVYCITTKWNLYRLLDDILSRSSSVLFSIFVWIKLKRAKWKRSVRNVCAGHSLLRFCCRVVVLLPLHSHNMLYISFKSFDFLVPLSLPLKQNNLRVKLMLKYQTK